MDMSDIPYFPTDQVGVFHNIPNDAYHADRSAVSSSQLKRLLISPADFLAGMEVDEQEVDDKLFGSVIHGRILEPQQFGEQFFAMPDLNRRTKIGKATYEAFAEEAGARSLFPSKWSEDLDAIDASVRSHARARELLSEGEAEVTVIWIDPETGIRCKVKVDWWHKPTLIADLKSTVDATREGFSRACARFGYALSAAFYVEGVFQATGIQPDWEFIAVQKSRPYHTAVYKPSDRFIRRGRADFRRALRLLAQCRATGEFPGLQPDGRAEEIDLPGWA